MPIEEHAPTDLRPTIACLSTVTPDGGEGLSRIRRAVRAWLEMAGVTAEADSAVLLVNELITNGQQHAPGPVRLRLFLRPGLLHCEVLDAQAGRPLLLHARPDDEDGRGLQLVDALAMQWGWLLVGRGKVVWFDMPVSGMATESDGLDSAVWSTGCYS